MTSVICCILLGDNYNHEKTIKLVTNKNKNAILELATKSISKDLEGYRSEFVRLVETAN